MENFWLNLLIVFSSCFVSLQQEPPPPTVYLIGGSTTSDYSVDRYPRMGWGQAMPHFFSPDVRFANRAVEGRSTKSFINEGRWGVIMERVSPGDYVFIQFGHNDQKKHALERYTEPFAAFYGNLQRYVQETRNKQAIPILVTPINRRKFDRTGRLINTLGLYPAAIRKVSIDFDVPLVDLHATTEALFNELGPEASKKLFMWLAPGDHQNYPEGVEDDTHLSETGAVAIAQLVVQAIQQDSVALVQYLR